jgi:integrase
VKERREQGSGSVYQLPSGRWIARIVLADGKRHNLGTYDTEEEAQGILDGALVVAAERQIAPVGGLTMLGWFPGWLDDLELSREYVAMRAARSIWRNHLAKAPFAGRPLRAVTPSVIEDWIGKLARSPALATSYLESILGTLRKGLAAAVKAKVLESNPAKDVHLPRRPVPTRDPWTYLDPSEQLALVGCPEIPLEWRLIIQFAIGSGMRSGEQFRIHLTDVHLDEVRPWVKVRFGASWRAPKGRKLRRVYLTAMALAALRSWLELLPEWCKPSRNKHGYQGAALVFPGPRGGVLDSDHVRNWKSWVRAAGIERNLRWHDLRHSCAASLVSGWWGRAWLLHEVRDLLGHSTLKQTEMYAHLAPDSLAKAASETTLPTVSQRPSRSSINHAGNASFSDKSEPSTAQW